MPAPVRLRLHCSLSRLSGLPLWWVEDLDTGGETFRTSTSHVAVTLAARRENLYIDPLEDRVRGDFAASPGPR